MSTYERKEDGTSIPHRGCPKTRNRSCWCYALCTPKAGLGYCGRPAAHALLGRTQQAILAHKLKKQQEAQQGESL